MTRSKDCFCTSESACCGSVRVVTSNPSWERISHRMPAWTFSSSIINTLCMIILNWKMDCEPGPFCDLAGDLDPSSVFLNDPADDGESQTKAARLSGEVRIK